MYKIGELVVYSEHGVCKIDNISEKTYGGKTRTYYELHPIDNVDLIINIPVDNKKVVIEKVLEEDEAKQIIQSFVEPGLDWISDVKQRNKEYQNLVKTGDRVNISRLVNTLIRKKHEVALDKKQLGEQDKRLLTKAKHLLFEELAVSLNKSYEEIEYKVRSLMKLAS
jgi:CarD family transcriptional regulator